MGKKRLNRKVIIDHSIFLFPLCQIASTCDQLDKSKDVIEFLTCSCFLELHCFPSTFETSSHAKGKQDLSRLSDCLPPPLS